jgi:hypothetical protein
MRVLVICLLCLAAWTARVEAQVTIRSDTGATVAAITTVRDQFRTDLGGGTVAAANGSFGGVRREINWDGVPAAQAAPNPLPADFFNTLSPRGVVFSTPGTGFQVSGAASDGVATNFGNIDPSYTTTFQTFSPQRLFTPLNGNIFDVLFLVPGTTIPATVKGFGLVLTDVDIASTTAVQFFDAGNNSLGKIFVLPLNAGFSFLGGFVGKGQPRISRVRVTLGNAFLAPGQFDGGSDFVVADDFIYGEPLDVVFADGFE